MIKEIWRNQYASFLQEDGIHRDLNWLHSLPEDPVKAVIAIKSPLIMAGLPIALGLIDHLNDRFIDKDFYENIIKHESRHFAKDQSIEFEMPFNLFIVAERTFLNILHRGCAIASTANFYAERAKKFNIAILETRKTTPGLRSLEKYSAIIGGAKGHRFDLADSLMIKDNHKKFFGGLEKSWRFFNEHNVAYRNIIVEIHNLEELKVATKLG